MNKRSLQIALVTLLALLLGYLAYNAGYFAGAS